jgi:hypothetical protein
MCAVKPNTRIAKAVSLSALVHGVVLAGFGCAQPRRSFVPEVDPATLSDVAFTHYLAQAPVVTVDEGQRAVLMLVGTNDAGRTPDERRAALLRRGAIKPRWNLEPDQRLDFGTLAYMLRTVCEVPRGLNDVVSDWTGLGDRRAALRTCGFYELLPHRLPHEAVTGGELLSAITTAEAYLERHSPSTKPSG